MRIVTAFLVLLVTSCTSDSFAQVTLDRSTLDQVIGTTRTSVERIITDMLAVDAIIADSGANKTWDLTGFALELGDSTDLVYTNSLAGTPGDTLAYFSESNLVIMTDAPGDSLDFVAYNKVTNTEYHRLGMTFLGDVDDPPDGTLEVLGQRNEPADLIGVFPTSFGTSWEDNWGDRIQFIELLDFITTRTRSKTTVDSWGTVITPTGSHDVLRFHTITTDSTIFGTVIRSDLYEWIGADADVAFLSVSQSGGPTIMGYQFEKGTSGVSVDELAQFGIELGKNFPNPFAKRTVIPFELSQTADVELEVFNMLGQSVGLVVDQTVPAGRHASTWDAASMPAGMYFYRLTVDGKSTLKSMMLVD